MKHLRKFNEELKPRTYKKAASTLQGLGHHSRAKSLNDWASAKEEEQRKEELNKEIENWKHNVNEFAKFGKFKFNIFAHKAKSWTPGSGSNFRTTEGTLLISDDFYVCLNFDEYSLEDTIDDIRSGSSTISISGGLIPTSEEAIIKYKEIFKVNKKDGDFANGFFWGFWLNFKISLDGDLISVTEADMNAFDSSVSGYVSLGDRRSAGAFKILLKNIFEGKINYPSGRRDITDMHDFLETNLCNQSGLSSDYGLSMDHFAEAIKKMNTQLLVREAS
jgi:hypothetical protein